MENRLSFQEVSHTGDKQIKVYGSTIEKLFVHALQGMFFLTKPRKDQHHCLSYKRNICLIAPNIEILLVDFLTEALFLSFKYHEIYNDAFINYCTDDTLAVTVIGCPLCKTTGPEIKSVTYHQLRIEKKHDIWTTNIIFDI